MLSVKYADGSDALAVPACMIGGHHVQSTRTSREILAKAGIDLAALHEWLWRGFLKEENIPAPEILTQEIFEEILKREGLSQVAKTTRKNRNNKK